MQSPSKKQIASYEKHFRNVYTSLFATVMAMIFGNLYLYSKIFLEKNTEILFTKFHDKLFFNLLGLAIVLFAVIMIFYYFDNLDLLNKKAYLEDKKKRPLITKSEYLVGFAINMIFAPATLAPAFRDFLSTFGNVSPTLSGLFAIITMALIRLIQLGNLRMKWQDEIDHPLFTEKPMFKSSGDIDSFKRHYLFTKPILYVIIYTLCYQIASRYIIALLFSLYMIVTSLFSSIVLIISIPLAVFFALRILIMFKARRKLIKKLNALKREKYATVKYHGSKYLSSLFHFLKLEIEIVCADGEIYNCRVVTSGKVNSPMYFCEDKYYTEHGFHLRGGGLISSMGVSPFAQVVDISKMGGKTNPTNLILGFRREHKLVFPEKEGKCALIINPTPTTCFSLYHNIASPIDTGEDMKAYTAYTATGIYNTVKRSVNKDKYE